MKTTEIQTDIEFARLVACMLVDIDIKETEILFVATHPFTDSWIRPVKKSSNIRDISLMDLHDKEAQGAWKKGLKEIINQSDFFEILYLMNTPYILFFLNKVSPHLSDKDLAKALRSCWVRIECISSDCNINIKDIVSLFKRADKATLMDDEEREWIERQEEEVTLYRGVTPLNRKYKNALSWTNDYKTAVWFANRNCYSVGVGEVWELIVPKKNILCRFTSRESEVVINPYGLKSQIKVHEVEDSEREKINDEWE